ncbi:MAG: sugar phosphate isomerase/epimerase, partial [Bacteroidales bacterium]|nr:sugar phosphate isomerase/epimerase [Bacteroidales bacterium]
MENRRTFIKSIAAISAASMIFPLEMCSFPESKNKLIGLQLYSVRDLMKDDLYGTLKKVAKIGYNSVEAAGYSNGKFYGLKPKEFKKMVNDLGMILPSSHSGFELAEAQKVIDCSCEAGVSYLVCPWLPAEKRKSIDSYKKLVEDFNKIGELCQKSGIQFAYHNHDFEFNNIAGEIPYDVLLKETDEELVKMQLDIYWIIKAGYDPITYFKKYPGRFELWHVKDMEDNEERFFTEVGNGIIDFKEIFKYKELSGMKYFFVEQDVCRKHPLESVSISY